ncbi:hypothetical protein PHLGIDRAFT_17306 [Phlebiopsis gigantea 11061_1 CR5-6]|uniref:Uncharacterized protein n=1 Tax=Phlebiopsis gigantea (strain 11061_1 CR5-6) TaxID=745531 RepID=A0A0C3P9D2_PHLG1|nr:hypothetical protein PHLGIDRAFT_17306 [Phlebiopsis gigantea 11061_1 CR5-6]
MGTLSVFSRKGYLQVVAEILTDTTTGQLLALPLPTRVEELCLADTFISSACNLIPRNRICIAEPRSLATQLIYIPVYKDQYSNKQHDTHQTRPRIEQSIEILDRALVELVADSIHDSHKDTLREHHIFGECQTLVPRVERAETVRYELTRDNFGCALKFTSRRITDNDPESPGLADISDVEQGSALHGLTLNAGAVNDGASTSSSALSYTSIFEHRAPSSHTSPLSFPSSLPDLEFVHDTNNTSPFVSGDSRPVSPATWDKYIRIDDRAQAPHDDTKALATTTGWTQGALHNQYTSAEPVTVDPRLFTATACNVVSANRMRDPDEINGRDQISDKGQKWDEREDEEDELMDNNEHGSTGCVRNVLEQV